MCARLGLSAQLKKNLRQLVGLAPAPHGSRSGAEGWQILADIRWIQRQGQSEPVPVCGRYDDFIEYAKTREDMPFSKDNLRKFLNGSLMTKEHGVSVPAESYTKLKWRVVGEPLDAERWFRGKFVWGEDQQVS